MISTGFEKILDYPVLKKAMYIASCLILSSCSMYANITDLSSSPDLVHISSNLEPYTNGPVTLTLDFSQAQPDFNLSLLEVTNGIVSNLSGGPKVYQLTLTPQTDGVVEVKVAGKKITSYAVNASGQVYEDTYLLNYDTVIPVVSNIQRVSPLVSPGTATSVQVQVDVNEASYITFYSESSCTTQIGSATSNAGVANFVNVVSVSGVYNYHVIATDLAGNSSSCSVAYASYELDLIPPLMTSLAVTVQDPAASPGVDKTPTIRVSGYDDADSVFVYTSATCAASSLYGSGFTSGAHLDVTSTTDLVDGVYNFYVRLQDELGNATACSSVHANYILDTGAPSLASSMLLVNPLTSPSNDSTPTVDVLGVESGAVVKIFNDNLCTNQVASGTASSASIELTTSVLSEGTHNFYVEVIDIVGNSSGCSGSLLTYVLDTTPPATPSLALFNPASSPSNDTTPTLRASGVVSGDTVKIYTDNTCTTEVATGVASGTTIDLTHSTAVEGANNYYARAIDSLGNASSCSSGVSYTLDTVAPSAPSALALQNPLVSPSNDSTPTIRVSGVVSGDTVRLYKDSTCTVPNLVDTGVAAGTTIDLTSLALTEGSYVFYARSTDPAGNVSTCSVASVAYQLDLSAPTNPTGLTLIDPTSSPGNDSTPTVRVSGVSVGDTVEIYSSNLCTGALASGVVSSGTTIDLVVAPALTDGTYNFYVKVDDPSSNTTGCLNGSLAYVLDTIAPAAPNSLTLHDPATSPNTDKTPTVRVGGVVAGDVVTLYRNNSCTLTVASATSVGTTIDLTPAADLSDATYNFYASSVDPAGNISTCSTATVSYVLDTVAPSNAVTLALETPATSPNNDSTPTIRVSSVVSGDSVRLYTDNTCTTLVSTGTASATDISLTSSVLTSGTYQFYAQMTDPTGNVSLCSTNSVSYVLDLTAPATPTPLTLITPASSPGNVKRPVIRAGGVISGDTISLYNNSACLVGNLVVSGVASGTSIDLTTPSDLADGTHNFYIRATDPATNASACSVAPLVYVLDTSVPAAPTSLTLKNPVVPVGQNRTPEITIGGVEVNAVVSLYSNSMCTTNVGEGTAGTTTIDIIVDNNLADGTYVFYATQTDASGNTSACSTANVSYTVDNVAPSAPSSLALHDPATSPGVDSTPTIQVSGVTIGDTAYLYTDAACTTQVGTQSILGTTVNVTSSVLAQGTYDFYAKAVDSAGNASDCSTNKVTYTYSMTKPDVTLAANVSGTVFDKLIFVTVTVSESVTGFTLADITVSGGTAQNLTGSGTSYAFEVVNQTEGTVNIQIPVDSFVNGTAVGNNASNLVSYTYDKIEWQQQAFVKAANADASDYFGQSVDIDGDTMVSGAPDESSSQTTITNGTSASTDNGLPWSGAVYVYKRNGSVWAQEAYIKAVNPDVMDAFGTSLSLNQNTIAVGAYGESSNQTTITNGSTASSNSSLSSAGAVYIYKRSGSNWAQEAYIKPVNISDGMYFGARTFLDGDTLVVSTSYEKSNQTTITNGEGASNNTSLSNAGAAYVYRRSGVLWAAEAYIKAGNNAAETMFGDSVGLHKDTIVVGASREASAQTTITNGTGTPTNSGKSYSGAVYVYKRTSNIWNQEAYIKASNADVWDTFGTAVSIYEDTIAVSAPSESSSQTTITNGSGTSADNSSYQSGAVYIYTRSGVTWSQQSYIKPANSAAGVRLGSSVSLSKNLLAVGASYESSNQTSITNGETASTDVSAAESGAVYVYRRYGSQWLAEAYIKAVNNRAGNYFGFSVVADGNSIVVGSFYEGSNQQGITNGTTAGSGTGKTQSGAVYVYTDNQPIAHLSSGYLGSVSNETSLNMTIGGANAVNYRYKVGPAGSTDCSDITGYSASIPVSTPISSLLSGYADVEMILCVIGENSSGVLQSVAGATTYRWTKDTTAPSTPGSVVDGVTQWLTGASTPTFNWTASTDATSGISQYEVSLGSSAGATNYYAWTAIPANITSTSMVDLPIPYGATVYFNIRAKDGAGNLSSVASSDGYLVTCNSSATWCPESYIKAVNADAGDFFGRSVSISNDTLAVGAESEGSSQTTITNGPTASSDNSAGTYAGAVYVYRRSGVTWAQEAYIKASNAEGGDYFGASVSVSGDTLVVGAYLEDASDSTITNGTSSTTNNGGTESGAVYVYKRTGTTWVQQAYIKASNNATGLYDSLGYVVDLNRDTIVVSQDYDDSSQTTITNGATASSDESAYNSGAAFVYRRYGNLWVQEAYLKASNADTEDNFGISVAISGDTIVVGAHREGSSQSTITNGTGSSSDKSSTESGAAYVYRRLGSNWHQEAYIKAANVSPQSEFGKYVSISGDTIAVGSLKEDSAQTTITNGSTASNSISKQNSGAVYVYKRTGTTWAQQAYIKANNADAGDLFGVVRLSGNLLIVGSDEDSHDVTITNGATASKNNGKTNSGAIYAYRRTGSTWAQEAFIKSSNASVGDYIGSYMAVNSDTIIAGSKREDSNVTTITNGLGFSSDDSKTDSGAVYVYRYQPTFVQAKRFVGVDVNYRHMAASGNVRFFVDYSDDNISWTTLKSQDVVLNQMHKYTLAWDDVGAHRYWRVRFTDPDDSVIGARADELYEVAFYQLNGVKVFPSTATRLTATFINPADAEEDNGNNEIYATWDGSNSGEISWDFGP